MNFVQYTISTIFRVLSLIVIVDIFLSFFVPPYNRIRMILDQIVGPMLRPIQRILPPIANLDFSPIVLLIIIQVVESLLIRLL
jgi:YggT family protein